MPALWMAMGAAVRLPRSKISCTHLGGASRHGKTPHVMLVGAGAQQFAVEQGLSKTEAANADSEESLANGRRKANTNRK